MISALVAALAVSATSPQASVTFRPDLGRHPITLTPQARLEAARRAVRGLGTFESFGTTRVRTLLEKGTSDFSIGANSPKGYADGVARFGTGSSFWMSFRAKPSKLYAVTIYGRFDCTSFQWRQDSSDPSVPGVATATVGSGDGATVLGLKAADKEVVLFVSQPKGGKGEFLVERAEITELN